MRLLPLKGVLCSMNMDSIAVISSIVSVVLSLILRNASRRVLLLHVVSRG
jgi:hypothetical protein